MSVHFPQTYSRYMHYRKKDDFIVIKYGAEWCRPCKAIKPLMVELAKKYTNVYFLDVDIDQDSNGNDKTEENEIMIDHPDFKNVRTIPHFKFFVNKELVREFHGADAERLKRYVSRYSQPKLDNNNFVVDNNNLEKLDNNLSVKDREVDNIELELREEVQEILDEMEKALDETLNH